MIKFCAIALAWIPLVIGQISDSPAPGNPVISTHSTLVLVPALVQTASRQLVYTLTADDFVVTDDGVEQKIAMEEGASDLPLALVIVVETGRAGARRLGDYRNLGSTLEAVVGNIPHKVAVVGFDSAPQLVQDFTPDLSVVAASLNDLKAGNSGDAILDSLKVSVDLLGKQPPTYRHAILLVSETLDHGSRIGYEDALRAISDTNTTIYGMGFSTTKADIKKASDNFNSDMTPAPPGGCMSKSSKWDTIADSQARSAPTISSGHDRLLQAYDCMSLLVPPLWAAKLATIAAVNGLERNVPQTLAELTGGEFYKFENGRGLQGGLMKLSNHLPNRYVLSFHPESPHPGLHSIALHLANHTNLVVTARHGYWADQGPAKEPHP